MSERLSPTPLAELRLADWRPVSQLRPRSTPIARAAFAAIDVHNHLGRWLSDGEWMIADPAGLVQIMDDTNVESIVNLDGMWGDEVTANVDRYDRAFTGRFLTFCQLDWNELRDDGGVQHLRASLDDSAARGARGLKIWKSLGLTVRDHDGALILPDDPRVIAVVSRAGELGLPVLIHTADPKAFFEPMDQHNERLDELMEVPEWWFGDPSRYPSFERLLAAHRALVAACPDVRFIGAHAGCAAEDLDLVEETLIACPNYTIDIAGRMAELGRQPRRFAELIARHPDRVLFGTDIYPAEREQFELHFRFLETQDEAFEYAPGSSIPPQGRWTVSALGLEAESLERIYRGNALRVLGM